ncbi:B12-binding domain-containing radical SAM protein [Terasakiella pusilla]|uniref:B12-binding domain-containing radical SAM protein n=1 Tax=Terasakiella pusilla TaxID=64973 RepID=UPI003AA90921
MKVLLITPPYYVPGETYAISVGQPLGIAYLGGSLREAGHDVVLVDGLMGGRRRDLTADDLLKASDPNGYSDCIRISRGVFQRNKLDETFPSGATTVGLSFEQVEEIIRKEKPDVVGISVIFTSIFKSGAHIAALIKKIDPTIITVMGGTHVTVSKESCLAVDAIDYIVTGEGEISFRELLDNLENEEKLKTTLGVGFVRDGETFYTPHELNYELDELAFPAFDLLEMDDYFETMAEGRAGKMYTTRGCPFACSFCSVPLTSERRFRVHSIERTIKEARYWCDTYNVETLIFEDDNINTNLKRYKALISGFLEADIGVKIDARNLRCDLLDEDVLLLMKKAGFETVWITPESGSQRVMDEIINKKMKVNESWAAAQRILKCGMDVGAAFVIGFPGETRKEIQKTIDFAYGLKNMGVKNFWFSIATPIEGTALYNRAIESGLIDGIDFDKFTYNTAVFDTDEFSAEELKVWRNELMSDLNEYANATCGKPQVA